MSKKHLKNCLYNFQNGPEGAGEGGADPALPGVPDQDVQQPPESFQPPPEQFQPPPEQFEQPPFEEQGFFDQGNTNKFYTRGSYFIV